MRPSRPRSRPRSASPACLALASLAEREVAVDAAAIGSALTAIREQLEVVRQLKSQLTSISNATKAVWTGLDAMRVEHPRPGQRGGIGDPDGRELTGPGLVRLGGLPSRDPDQGGGARG